MKTRRSLYDILVAPAASMIPQGSRVFVIPDRQPERIEFRDTARARQPKALHYWIEDVTVTNANSIRLLSRVDTDPSRADSKNLLLIGNPISPLQRI